MFFYEIKRVFVIVSVLFFLSSCASSPQEKPIDIKLTQCKTPKPNVCTREYKPVCGFELDGNHKVFGNACEACSSVEVTSYYPGTCK